MARQLQLRGDTAANWALANPVLAKFEIGIVEGTNVYKIGDGVTAWNSLPTAGLSPQMAAVVYSQPTTEPTTSEAGTLTTYAKDIASRLMLKMVGPSGLDVVMQPGLFNNSISMLMPSTTTGVTAIGIPAPTATGTVSTPTIVAGSGLLSTMRRTRVTSAATAGSVAQQRTTFPLCLRGDAAGIGGFFCSMRFAVPVKTSDSHFQIGLFNSLSLTAATLPSAQTNWIGMGYDPTDANYQIYCGSGAPTKIDLGSAFDRSIDTAVFEFTLFSPPNGSAVGYRVKRLDTGDVASGILTTNLPAGSTLLTYHAKLNNNASAVAVAFELMRFYLESDN